jgi:hypothetical protein
MKKTELRPKEMSLIEFMERYGTDEQCEGPVQKALRRCGRAVRMPEMRLYEFLQD